MEKVMNDFIRLWFFLLDPVCTPVLGGRRLTGVGGYRAASGLCAAPDVALLPLENGAHASSLLVSASAAPTPGAPLDTVIWGTWPGSSLSLARAFNFSPLSPVLLPLSEGSSVPFLVLS